MPLFHCRRGGLVRVGLPYFSYLVEVRFVGGGIVSTLGKPTDLMQSHWQSLSYKVVSSTPYASANMLQKILCYTGQGWDSACLKMPIKTLR